MSRRARHPPREFLWAANLWTQSSWTVREVRKAAWGFHLNGEKNVPHSFLFPMEILQCSFPSSFSQLVDYPINGGQLSSTALWELWWLRTISIEAGTLLSSPECFSRSHWLFCSFSNCSSLAEQEKTWGTGACKPVSLHTSIPASKSTHPTGLTTPDGSVIYTFPFSHMPILSERVAGRI